MAFANAFLHFFANCQNKFFLEQLFQIDEQSLQENEGLH